MEEICICQKVVSVNNVLPDANGNVTVGMDNTVTCIGSTILASSNTSCTYGDTVAGSTLIGIGIDNDGGWSFDNLGYTGTWLKLSANSPNSNGWGLYRRIA